MTLPSHKNYGYVWRKVKSPFRNLHLSLVKVRSHLKGSIRSSSFGLCAPPQLQSILRSLSVGKVTPPTQLGEWIILVRLEQLTKARFDERMRDFLLDKQLNDFLEHRTHELLCGHSLDPLEYESSS